MMVSGWIAIGPIRSLKKPSTATAARQTLRYCTACSVHIHYTTDTNVYVGSELSKVSDLGHTYGVPEQLQPHLP